MAPALFFWEAHGDGCSFLCREYYVGPNNWQSGKHLAGGGVIIQQVVVAVGVVVVVVVGGGGVWCCC